ncbi:MAG: carboxymuconolactone decarboxylase family protein [Phycisphaerales bacterium]|nr:carboxymuconolactone decarboxylase family protein [Phycisphaerales bacterium]
MPRIQPLTLENAPETTKPALEGIHKAIGMVPNLLSTLGHSPAALSFYTHGKEALGKGTLGQVFGEQLAMAIGAASGCDYCVAAHNAIGKNAGLSDIERTANIAGKSGDPKVQSAIDFAKAIVEGRGFVEDSAFETVKAAGYTDDEVLEILAITMFNLFTNYANHMIDTEIDFPKVEAGVSAG